MYDMKSKVDAKLNELANSAWREFVDQHPPVRNESNLAYENRLKVGFRKALAKRGVTVTN